MVPPRQRLCADQPVISAGELRLIDHLDFIEIERAQQIGFELHCADANAGRLTVSPQQAPSGQRHRAVECLPQSVEHRACTFALNPAQQRRARA